MTATASADETASGPAGGTAGGTTLSRAVRVLEAFGPDLAALSVAEIARRSGVSMATTSRMVAELVRLGLLERGADRRVRAGLRLRELASRAASAGLREAAAPFMEDLHAVVGHHVHLGVLEDARLLVVERLSAPDAVVDASRFGGRLPAHASSGGLVLLAHAPAEVRERVLAGRRERFTAATVTDPARLRTLLADVRRGGFAFCRGHVHPRAAGIAAPVRDARGRVVAALTAVVPNDAGARAQVSALRVAARGVSRALGARPA
ncbi:IclR family transcriptional regulator [Actinomadura kijaniata]|uniref:IclR family transcriptional regulator n=1 Tax=Actinomadura kijaniata TaxID=46161 RepID=UPI00083358F4|nr:IclR family transcriptional regulator [Actinomadura kijaniata]